MSTVSNSKPFVPLRSSIVGYVDYCDSQRVSGWLIDLADVMQHLQLKVLIDDVEVCSGVADKYRQDLAANPAFANTFHAYDLEIPNILSDGKEHEVKVVEVETGYVLKNSPVKVLSPKLSDKSNAPRLDLALVGKNGWMFLCNDSNDAIGQYTGRLKLTSEVLEQYVNQYRSTQSLYRNKGICYLLVITPGKESIYSEFLPDSITADTGLTVKDQFIAAVNPVLDVDILDLKPVLLANKSRGQLCYKNDSHWNYLGAMIACQVIIEKLREKFTNIPEFDVNAFALINGNEGACDLSGKTRLNYINGKYVENVERLEQPEAVCAISVQYEKKAIELFDHPYKELSTTRPTRLFKNKQSANLPRAIIIRDSYADWMIPFLSEYFSECLFVWARYVEQSVVELFEPDVIIEQVVDRFLVSNRVAVAQINHLNTSINSQNPSAIDSFKPYIYGMSPYIPDAPFLETDELFKQCGGNTGNLIFCHAISRMLDVGPETIPWGGDISHLSETHDRLVMPMANFLGPHVDMSRSAVRIEKIQIPIIGIGLGAQGPITGVPVDSIPEGSWKWLEAIANKSATDKPNISLRGQATYDVISAKGLADKCTVIGCPSNFINPSRTLGKSIYERFKKSSGRLRRIAVTAGSVAPDRKRLEQSLVSLMEKSNGLYICQAPIDFLRLYRQEYENISPQVFSRYKDCIHPEMDDDAFLRWFYRWSYAFTSASEWLSMMTRFDIVVGTRIHGVMAGIQAGTPSICFCIDSRTLELCQTMMIPYAYANDYKEGISLEQIDEIFKQWDWQLFDVNRRYLAEGYKNFLINNGLQSANYLKLLAH